MTRVAIAEDNAATQLVLELLFSDSGHEVVGMASDGCAAVELVRDTRPDVLVLDLDMPRLDGHGVVRILRGEQPDLRIVLYSATEVLDGSIDVDATVPKSASPQDLLASVSRLGRDAR